MKLGNFTSFFTDKRDGPHFKRKKKSSFHPSVCLSVCLSVGLYIVSAFLLVPSLYVTSPTTTDCAIPILSLPASVELMVVSFSSFLIISYHESANDAGLRHGKIVYDLDTAIVHLMMKGWIELC